MPVGESHGLPAAPERGPVTSLQVEKVDGVLRVGAHQEQVSRDNREDIHPEMIGQVDHGLDSMGLEIKLEDAVTSTQIKGAWKGLGGTRSAAAGKKQKTHGQSDPDWNSHDLQVTEGFPASGRLEVHEV